MRFLLLICLLITLQPLSAAAQNYTLDDDLLYRINFGSAEDVKLLLDKGANPNAKTKQGETALVVAIQRNDKESAGIAQALIDKGANLDVTDKAGNAPIFNAIRYKQPLIAKALLLKGANFHAKNAQGITVLDFATQNGDKDTAQLVQSFIDKENAYASSLRTPERYKEIVAQYAIDSCLYQYWSYFLASRQAPEKDADTQKKVNAIKQDLHDLIVQIQKYYATASTQELNDVANQAVSKIYTALDSLISNSNRTEKGVGSDADAKARCEKIVADMKIDFLPAAIKN